MIPTPIELSDPVYSSEDAARLHMEMVRWPDGVVCPHPNCGSKTGARPVQGDSMGPGWFYCTACQDKFTVRTGTVWERSHIPLHKWLLATRLMASSKKGISAHQIHRTLKITYKSAWFLCHRIREAMADNDPAPLGGEDQVVEADETFIGPSKETFTNDKGWQRERGTGSKRKVLSLVERGGRVRSVKIETLQVQDIQKVVTKHVSPRSELHTDDANHYVAIGRKFAAHEVVTHSAGEYARGSVTTNNVEGYFSIFKRGMIGIYQHCGEQHLQRYLHEFDFRYSNRARLGIDDAHRTTLALKGAEGKRLTYRRLDGSQSA